MTREREKAEYDCERMVTNNGLEQKKQKTGGGEREKEKQKHGYSVRQGRSVNEVFRPSEQAVHCRDESNEIALISVDPTDESKRRKSEEGD